MIQGNFTIWASNNQSKTHIIYRLGGFATYPQGSYSSRVLISLDEPSSWLRFSLSDSSKDYAENISRHGDLSHLEHHIPRMPDHVGCNLDQLLTQCSQRARLHLT